MFYGLSCGSICLWDNPVEKKKMSHLSGLSRGSFFSWDNPVETIENESLVWFIPWLVLLMG